MDVHEFATELLQGLTDIALFDQVTLHSEGPIANGRAFFEDDINLFLRFYYNSKTGTLAFALIENKRRIWGIDYDSRRGWHLHPADDPTAHEPISKMPIQEIVMTLGTVLTKHNQSKSQQS
jgi:hypothetical protein